MRIVRFEHRDLAAGPVWGIHEGGAVRVLTAPPFDGPCPGGETFGVGEVRMLAPVQPGKIVAVGFNYTGHLEEMRDLQREMPSEPLLFLKAPSSVLPPGEPIVLPPESKRVDYEGELALVIGRGGRRIPESEADRHVLGCTILNDVTARDLQKRDGQFARAKSFDTFCPLGPWIETDVDPSSVGISTYVNGELRQRDDTSTLLFGPAFLVHHVSRFMTLMPGDVIATGTPAGVGPLEEGDLVTVAVEGIGELTNPVVREKH